MGTSQGLLAKLLLYLLLSGPKIAYLLATEEMQKEMEKHMAHLQQLKDFDEILALEREEKARQEQERRRIEVKIVKITERVFSNVNRIK